MRAYSSNLVRAEQIDSKLHNFGIPDFQNSTNSFGSRVRFPGHLCFGIVYSASFSRSLSCFLNAYNAIICVRNERKMLQKHKCITFCNYFIRFKSAEYAIKSDINNRVKMK